MSDSTITRGRATVVGLSSVYSAGVAYLTMLIAAHSLPPAENALFLIFWALLFGGFGVVTGVSSEAARASYRSAHGGGGASVLLLALGYGTVVAGAILVTAPTWGPRILHGHTPLILVVAVACVAYAGHLAVWGVVTGRRRWSAVAGLMVGESTVRLGLVGGVYLSRGSLGSLAIAAALPALVWTVALVLPVFAAAARQRADVEARVLMRNYAVASLASAASALVMVGYPVLLSATSSSAEVAVSAGLMLGISLTRAPLLVPLTTFQGVALAHFLGRPGGWALLRTAGPVLAITGVGAAVAYVVGPQLFHLLLGGRYELDGATLAALTISAGLLATLTLTGMFALAVHRHALFAAGWLSTTAAAVALLLVPLPLTERVLLSLLLCPLVGMVVHGVGLGVLHRNDRRTQRQ